MHSLVATRCDMARPVLYVMTFHKIRVCLNICTLSRKFISSVSPAYQLPCYPAAYSHDVTQCNVVAPSTEGFLG